MDSNQVYVDQRCLTSPLIATCGDKNKTKSKIDLHRYRLKIFFLTITYEQFYNFFLQNNLHVILSIMNLVIKVKPLLPQKFWIIIQVYDSVSQPVCHQTKFLLLLFMGKL